MLHKPCSNWVPVHVIEFLFQFLSREYIERVVPDLPDALVVERVPVVRPIGGIPLANGFRRLALQLVHEAGELAEVFKPDQGVDMIWHNNEAGTKAGPFMQAPAKVPNDDSLGVILLKKLASVIAGEGGEMNVPFIISNSTRSLPFCHDKRLSE